MATAPNTTVVTGPNNQQVDASTMLVTPTSGTQASVADMLGGAAAVPALTVGAVSVTGLARLSIQNSVTASTTQTLAGGTKIVANTVIVTKCASSGDALTLPVSSVGQSVFVLNNGAAPAAVFPGEAGTKIDAGSAGASVTVTNGKQAQFTNIGAADWITTLGGTLTKAS